MFETPSEGNEFVIQEPGEKCIEVRKEHRKEKTKSYCMMKYRISVSPVSVNGLLAMVISE